jgi:hypothetical protein
LAILLLGLLATTLIFHLLHGEGAIDLMMYLQTYCLLLLPSIFFVSACALLFESVPFLMGKFGDVLFFCIWVAQITLVAAVLDHDTARNTGFVPVFALDFLGIGSAMMALTNQLHTTHIAVGMAPFDPTLASISFTDLRWPLSMLAMRASAATLALFPVLPALLLFHRFSPDRVKASHSAGRRNLLALINARLRPLVYLVQPLFTLAQRSPGWLAHIVAEIAVSFTSFPIAVIGLALSYLFSVLAPLNQLPAMLAAMTAFWGIFISDISCRDHRAQLTGMVCAINGGGQAQNSRQLFAAFSIGLLFAIPIIVRQILNQSVPLEQIGISVASLITGLFSLSALANLFGRCTGSARLFMALFLFALYAALNAKYIPNLDAVGFNGVANLHSIGLYVLIGLTAWLASVVYQARYHR